MKKENLRTISILTTGICIANLIFAIKDGNLHAIFGWLFGFLSLSNISLLNE